MGYVIQSGGLFPHLTARENLTLVTGYLEWPQEKKPQRIEELCDLTNISSSDLDRPPDGLSGGQAQRISLMRALMLDPELYCWMNRWDPSIRWFDMSCSAT